MEMRDMGFEGINSGANGFGEFIQEDEEALEPLEVEDSLMLDIVEVEPEFEPEELQSSEDEKEELAPDVREPQSNDEQLRLLRVYFKDMAHETTLLTPEKELEIWVNIRKCEARARKTKVLLDKPSKVN